MRLAPNHSRQFLTSVRMSHRTKGYGTYPASNFLSKSDFWRYDGMVVAPLNRPQGGVLTRRAFWTYPGAGGEPVVCQHLKEIIVLVLDDDLQVSCDSKLLIMQHHEPAPDRRLQTFWALSRWRYWSIWTVFGKISYVRRAFSKKGDLFRNFVITRSAQYSGPWRPIC